MTGFSDWERQFNGQIKLVVQANEKVFKESVKELSKRITDRTPVGDPSLWRYPAHKDYKPGTLKAAWTLELSSNYARIENLTPYAYRVEAVGWSYIQAPNGMMRISVKEFPSILDSIAKKYKI